MIRWVALLRTFAFSVIALGFLLAGLYLCLRWPPAGNRCSPGATTSPRTFPVSGFR